MTACCRGTAPTRELSVRKPIVRVGTAGWTIPSRYQSLLAGDGSHLERYANRLNAVEMNSRSIDIIASRLTFVGREVFLRISAGGQSASNTDTTANSRRYQRYWISLLRRSADWEGSSGAACAASAKAGFEAPVARRFFSELRKRIDVPIPCEPRHPSWGSQRAASVLTECAVARLAADPSPLPGADEPGGSKQLAYFGWHGQRRKYYSDYDREQLEALWRQLAVASKTAGQVWICSLTPCSDTLSRSQWRRRMPAKAPGNCVGDSEGISARQAATAF